MFPQFFLVHSVHFKSIPLLWFSHGRILPPSETTLFVFWTCDRDGDHAPWILPSSLLFSYLKSIPNNPPQSEKRSTIIWFLCMVFPSEKKHPLTELRPTTPPRGLKWLILLHPPPVYPPTLPPSPAAMFDTKFVGGANAHYSKGWPAPLDTPHCAPHMTHDTPTFLGLVFSILFVLGFLPIFLCIFWSPGLPLFFFHFLLLNYCFEIQIFNFLSLEFPFTRRINRKANRIWFFVFLPPNVCHAFFPCIKITKWYIFLPFSITHFSKNFFFDLFVVKMMIFDSIFWQQFIILGSFEIRLGLAIFKIRPGGLSSPSGSRVFLVYIKIPPAFPLRLLGARFSLRCQLIRHSTLIRIPARRILGTVRPFVCPQDSIHAARGEWGGDPTIA